MYINVCVCVNTYILTCTCVYLPSQHPDRASPGPLRSAASSALLGGGGSHDQEEEGIAIRPRQPHRPRHHVEEQEQGVVAAAAGAAPLAPNGSWNRDVYAMIIVC